MRGRIILDDYCFSTNFDWLKYINIGDIICFPDNIKDNKEVVIDISDEDYKKAISDRDFEVKDRFWHHDKLSIRIELC